MISVDLRVPVINDNYFCRLPRTRSAGSWSYPEACETARFPRGGRVGHGCAGSAIAGETDVGLKTLAAAAAAAGMSERTARRWQHGALPSTAKGAADVADAGGPVRRCVRRWRTAWRTACQAAGVPTRFLHDCRRTAARNLIRASVPERVAMLLTGHKTRAIFDRYNIINEQELLEAGDQLVEYLAQHAQATPRGARPTGTAAPRTAPPLRLVRRTTA